MNYRLGIDLGTSSLGWCCLKTEGEMINILDMGVRIFPDGRNDKTKEPLCVSRRSARSSRVRLKRFQFRQRQLIADLQQVGLLPIEKEELKKLERIDPYKLRASALHRELSLYEIGRVIFHLNQRRGFLSNRLENKKAGTASTKTQKAMDNLTKLMAENNSETLGEYMYKTGIYRFKNATDTTGKLIIDIYPSREMYQNEFDKIWEKQKHYHFKILTDELKYRLKNYDIFYQRPLKKQETGFCSLETEERRSPRAYPIAQEFRICEEIANLKITYPEERLLSQEERENLFAFLNTPDSESYDKDYIISFEQIIQLLNLPKETSFNLMVNNRQGLLCNITNAILENPSGFGKNWYYFSPAEQEKIIDVLQDYSLTKDQAEDLLKNSCSELSKQQMDNILEQSLLLMDGYANLSAKAMRKLIEYMKLCCTDYMSAIENVYHKTLNELKAFPTKDLLPKYQELFSEQLIGADKKRYLKEWDYDNYMGRITNVSVHIALNQLRQVVNELIAKYGKPEGITIELGRELKNGKKALAQILKKQKENAEIMNEARREIRKANMAITPFNIEKYKVWRNLNPKDVTKRIDLYTGKNISVKELFSSEYEIEHILPYSWSYDDSYNNKIITRSTINRKKSNQLPYHFFTDTDQLSLVAKNREELSEMDLEKVKERAKDIDKARGNIKKTFNFKAITWRFSKNAREIFNKNNKNMARDLTDMQYMSKLARKYLTCICEEGKIVSAKGQITDQMKKIWNIADTLPEDYRLWSVQKWQKEAVLEKEIQKIENANPDLNRQDIEEKAKEIVSAMSDEEIHNNTFITKDRSIHYHHALDAFVLSNITPSIVQFISGTDFANKVEAYQQAKRDNTLTLNEARTGLLKQMGKFYEKPYPQFDKEEFAKQLANITVSYKEPFDKLKNIMKKANALGRNMASFGFASINKDSAFGFRRITKMKSDDIELEFSIRKNGTKVRERKSLSCMVPIFRTREQKLAFHQKYTEWLCASVRKKIIGSERYKEIETDFINTFTKEKAFKWHESDENYAAQIYQINKNDKFFPNKKEEWSLEILSNYYAFERKGRFFWKDMYPTAKLITTIRNNDIIAATFSANDELEKGFSCVKNWIKEQFRKQPTKQQLDLLFRVKKLSGGSIFLRPLHIAQEDADKKSWCCSVSKFKEYHCLKVRVSATGKLIGG